MTRFLLISKMARPFACHMFGFLDCYMRQRGQRKKYQLSSRGIHWEAIEEDPSVDGLLARRSDMTILLVGTA